MNRLDVKRDLRQTLRRVLGAAAGIAGYLSTRLTAAMVTLVLLTATTVGLLTYRNVEALVLPRALDRIDTHARLLAAELEASVRGARADVIGFRSAVAVDGIVRASLAGGVDSRDGMSVKQWRDRLALRFVAELEVKPNYLQFRIIGLADGGREILRVDRATPDGAIRIVPDAELQRRGERDYFARTIALPVGGVDISQVELNQEHGAVDGPRVPVVRAATPIHAQDGRPFGIVIINVDLHAAFARIRSAARPQGRVFVVNERGDYLVHPDPEREFGFELGKPARVQDDFPELAGALANGEIEPRVVQDASGRRFGMALASVRLAGGPRVTVIEAVPHSQIMVAATAARDASLLAGFLAVLGAMALALLLARSLARPLVQMARAVESFGRNGWSLMVPAKAGGEIGVLAGAFRRMAGEVREKAAALQQEIEERSRLFDTSPDLILVTDRQGNFIRVNPASKVVLGYTPREMIGHSAVRFIHPEDLESTRAEMRAARRGRLTRNFETRYFHKDGRAVTLAWSGVWSDVEQKHFFIGRDRTEQTLAEDKFRLAVEASPSGMVMVDGNGAIVLVNAETERLFGYRREELLGQPIDVLVPPAVRVRHSSHRSDFTARPSARPMGAGRDLHAYRKDGTQFPVEIGLNPIHTPHGLLVLGIIVDVSERNRAEQALRESEERFRTLMQFSFDVYWETDAQHRFTRQEFAEGVGDAPPAGSEIGKTRWEVPHLEPDEEAWRKHRETLDAHLPFRDFELARPLPGGRKKYVSVSGLPMFDASGRFLGYRGVGRHITERKLAEEALRESEARLAAAQRIASVGHWERDLETDQITWSDETYRIFGLRREERFLSVAQFAQLLHPEDRQFVLEAQTQARRGDTRYDVEYRVVRPGGEVRFVHSQADVITDESGRPRRMFGAVQDITERKRAEEALLESERMAHDIIATALDAFVQMDEGGTIVEWNPQAEAIFGWSRAEAVGQPLASLIVPPAHREQHKAGLSRFLHTGESGILGKRFEIEALRRDGKQIEVELTITALRRLHGHMFNGFVRDVTQRIKLEQQLRQSQKMEAVGQLTGGIAHDFNNLLTVILGNLELLDRKLTDDASRSLSSETRDAAEMGARLTDRLLTIARQQRLETRRINLNSFILNLSEFLRRTIGPTIGLSTSLSTSLWPTMADAGQIESAVLNLAINARDAMPKGGKLAIQTMNVTLDAEAVANIPGLAQGDYVVLSVSDTGHGMTAEVRARAFEPFFTTKGMEKGSGLGLATIYGFARQSGGNVTIYSELGQGTTVKLYLPRATDGQIEVNAATATATEHLGRGESVLVVEDDEHVRRLTVMRLVDLGYRVLDVADGNSALEVLSSRPDVDMVFSDLVMPGGLSGLDLARRVKELHPKAKVVLTSGYSAALMHDEAIELLELQILRKPYRQSELARIFREVLNAP